MEVFFISESSLIRSRLVPFPQSTFSSTPYSSPKARGTFACFGRFRDNTYCFPVPLKIVSMSFHCTRTHWSPVAVFFRERKALTTWGWLLQSAPTSSSAFSPFGVKLSTLHIHRTHSRILNWSCQRSYRTHLWEMVQVKSWRASVSPFQHEGYRTRNETGNWAAIEWYAFP